MPSDARVHRQLSPREREIVILVAQGYNMQKIAEVLGIAFKTVDTHRSNVSRKLGISGNAELLRYALREKLISL